MIQTIRKAWGVPELRKKIVFTLLILLIFRIGNAIPVPYINTTLLGNYLDSMSGTVLGLYNVMSGSAFAEATVFALGVQPYINSSIIIQLLTIAIPALERLARDGGEGVDGSFLRRGREERRVFRFKLGLERFEIGSFGEIQLVGVVEDRRFKGIGCRLGDGKRFGNLRRRGDGYVALGFVLALRFLDGLGRLDDFVEGADCGERFGAF